MRKTLLKFKIIRVRIKISYLAFIKTQTILALFLQRIIDSYEILNGLPEIFKDNKVIEEFHESIELGAGKAFRFIIEFNCKIGVVARDDLEEIFFNDLDEII